MTPKSELLHEAERCGPVLAVAKDPKHKEALVEFKNAGDAGYAYDKLHGMKMGESPTHTNHSVWQCLCPVFLMRLICKINTFDWNVVCDAM